jgi:3-oxosteroid 1-dehydrogenase
VQEWPRAAAPREGRAAVAQAAGPEDLDADVVCLGSGLGALAAAIAAHDAGARVAILEKAPKLGGVSAYSAGEVWLPNNAQLRAAGLEDSDEDGRRYLEFLSGGFADPELQGVLLGTAHEAIGYFERRAGVRWHCLPKIPDYYYPRVPSAHRGGRLLAVDLFRGAELGRWQSRTFRSPHMPMGLTHADLERFGGLANVAGWDYRLLAERIEQDLRATGPALAASFVKAAAIDRAIPTFVACPGRALVAERGEVVGVRAEREGREVLVRARRGVVIATGGYDHDEALARRLEAVPEWKSMCPPYVTGDHLVLAGELGAQVAAVPAADLAMFLGYHVPGEEHEGVPLYRTAWELGCPHTLVVNRRGARFCDESFYRDYQPRLREWDGHANVHPNLPCFLIFDAGYRERFPICTIPPGVEVPEAVAARGETPHALAAALGVDGDGLAATLERFNAFAREGVDRDFGRGRYGWSAGMVGDGRQRNPSLGPLEKPPYYGLRLSLVGAGINSHGLRTDRFARVVHVRGHAIPGLYAVGNSAALLDLGAGYQSGTSNLRALTWGFVAGRHAAARTGGAAR